MDFFDVTPPTALEVRVAAHRLAQARAWYGRFFPAVAPDVFQVGPRTLVLRAPVREDDPRGAVLDLKVPELTVAVEALMEPGAVWLEDILLRPDGGFSTDLVDPLGTVWRLHEPAGAPDRLPALRAYAARYMGRLTRLGAARPGAEPWPVIGRFGACAEAAGDAERWLGPPHIEAFGGLRQPRAVRAWRYQSHAGHLVDVEQPTGGPARLYADPPDLGGALAALGLDPADWAARTPEPPAGPEVLVARYTLWHQPADGEPQAVAEAHTDYGARRWAAVLEARLGAQTVWAERADG